MYSKSEAVTLQQDSFRYSAKDLERPQYYCQQFMIHILVSPSVPEMEVGLFATGEREVVGSGGRGGHPFQMQLWWSLCTLSLFACQTRVAAGDLGLFLLSRLSSSNEQLFQLVVTINELPSLLILH